MNYKKVLVIVDMQNDFIDGSLGSPVAQAIVPEVRTKFEKAMLEEDTYIIFTKDTHFEDYMKTFEGKKLPIPHCINETYGWEISENIASGIEEMREDVSIVCKNTFGHLYWDCETFETNKEFGNLYYDILSEVEEIEICGLCTDICVVSNALILRAFCPETRIIVDSAACAGTSEEAHNAALTVMKSCQIDVI